jgi:hypothetical protein
MSATGTAATQPQVDRLKKYETVVSSGQSALRALLTLNGGATIAFLTFLGHLWEKGKLPPPSVQVLVAALESFVYGTFSAVLAYGTIFLTNCVSTLESDVRSDGWRKVWSVVAYTLFGITVIIGTISIGYFLSGSRHAVAGFETITSLLPK